MGYKLALSGVVVVLVIAGVAAIGSSGGGGEVVGAQARAASAHASTARVGRLPATARRGMNRFRARHGRHRLRYSRSLSRSARRHARYMARNGFGHLSTIRASRAFSSVAEIILRHAGAHGQPHTAIRGWANSAPHRSIMLSARYNAVGIGKVSRGGSTYWVAHLGRR
jgi:uncharacterized protein YkwD